MPAEPRNILLVQTAFLGDIVLFTPLAAAARAKFPGASISLMTTPAGAELLRGLPGVDEIIAFDKRGREAGLSGLRARAADLKSRGFKFSGCESKGQPSCRACSPHQRRAAALDKPLPFDSSW